MRGSKKIMIDRYVNLRCKKLQEQTWTTNRGNWQGGDTAVKSTTNTTNTNTANRSNWQSDRPLVGADPNTGVYTSDFEKTYGPNYKPPQSNWTYDQISSGLQDAGNVPVLGKIPGFVGGVMDVGKGLATGDWRKAAGGGVNALFSGIPGVGSVGKNIANYGKNKAADYITNQAGQYVAGETTKIGAKNLTKNLVDAMPDAYNQTSDYIQRAGGPKGVLSNLYNKFKNRNK